MNRYMKNLSACIKRPSKARAGRCRFGLLSTAARCSIEQLEVRALLSPSIVSVAPLIESPEGANPVAVTFDDSGNLFGTAYGGGVHGDGTVFEIARGSRTLTTVANFNTPGGAHPEAAVTFDSSGNLFGTTTGGDADGDGTVFEIARPALSLTTVASFDGANGGANPYAGVNFDSSGDLFGTTGGRSAYGDGTVFEIASGSGTITTVASFNGANGSFPAAGLTFDSSGNLFGTTASGGAAGDGAIFEIKAPA